MEIVGVNPQFWKSKKVLVTGHTGFKGSWLCLWLQKLGASVIGYSLPPPTQPSLFDLGRVDSDMVSIFGDVRDLSCLTAAFLEHSPEIVIHMAAQSLVRESYRDPVGTYQTNVMGTVHVLEAARRCESVRALVVVTSDKCYENREWVWPYRENEPLGGLDPYSSSKACAELVTAAYRHSFCMPENMSDPRPFTATARAGNVIGGGDWAQDRLVPDCIRAFIAGKPVHLRYPLAVRPWQHVLESLSGYMTLTEHLFGRESRAFCEAWNFGPNAGDTASVGEVAQRVGRLWGDGLVVLSDETDAPHEADLLRLDATKASTRLGWRQRWSFDRMLQETVAWYNAWHDGRDMRTYTLRQISTYESGD